MSDETQSIAPAAVEDSGRAARIARHFPRIEGYRVVDVLGQGGMGIVYRAVQTKLNRTVALKVLPAMVGSASPSAAARFRHEATAAARLHHTNIVPIYDFGESPDAYYYAMELISGQPLNVVIQRFAEQNASTLSPARFVEVLHATVPQAKQTHASEESGIRTHGPDSSTMSSSMGRGRLYYQQVSRWVADAAEALHYAHGQRIIHRDIKPANLILSIDGRIMVTDFGLAKSEDEESVTMTGSLLGTVRYLSPEQAMAKRIAVDHRTDIYSLGATMYELLTFQPAFPGNDDKKILAAIIQKDPIPPRRIAPTIPQELQTICMKALEKAPDSRYGTAHELAEDLRRYLNDLPIVAKRPGLLRRTAKFAKRHKAAVVAVAASALLLVFVGVSIRAYSQRETARAETLAAQAERLIAQVEGLVEEGLRLQAHGKWGEAEKKFHAALKLDPKHVRALGNLAIIKKESYNRDPERDPALLEEGITFCDRALALSPDHTALWNLNGVLLKKLGRYMDARASYAKATELDPHNVAAWHNLGVVTALAGDLGTAEENLGHAAELAEEPGQSFCYAWRELAQLQALHGNRLAVENINKALACDPSDVASYLVRARLRLTLESYVDPEEAFIDAKTADRLAGQKNPIVKRLQALALLRKGEFDRAAKDAQTAIEMGDLAVLNHLIIAIAEARLGDTASARTQFESAIYTWPADLQDEGDFQATAPEAVLWVDTAHEIHQLRQEAEKLILPDSRHP
jgi:serine/threonine protein kinase/Flp pilus assembly protein TadD